MPNCNRYRPRPVVEAPRYLSVWEVALLLSLDDRTIRRMCNRGQLEHERTTESAKGQLRIVARGPGERWIHPPGTFATYLDTVEGRRVRQHQAPTEAAPAASL